METKNAKSGIIKAILIILLGGIGCFFWVDFLLLGGIGCFF